MRYPADMGLEAEAVHHVERQGDGEAEVFDLIRGRVRLKARRVRR